MTNLKSREYQTAILSNTELPTTRYFFKNQYDKYFDALVFSCLEKTIRPEEKIYFLALNKLNVKPVEAVFFDDKIKYVEAARKIGINAFAFKSPDQLKKELAKLSVNFD